MKEAGLVFDYLGAERLKRVTRGQESLDAAVTQAKKERELQGRLGELPDDLRALVDAGITDFNFFIQTDAATVRALGNWLTSSIL